MQSRALAALDPAALDRSVRASEHGSFARSHSMRDCERNARTRGPSQPSRTPSCEAREGRWGGAVAPPHSADRSLDCRTGSERRSSWPPSRSSHRCPWGLEKDPTLPSLMTARRMQAADQPRRTSSGTRRSSRGEATTESLLPRALDLVLRDEGATRHDVGGRSTGRASRGPRRASDDGSLRGERSSGCALTCRALRRRGRRAALGRRPRRSGASSAHVGCPLSGSGTPSRSSGSSVSSTPSSTPSGKGSPGLGSVTCWPSILFEDGQ